MGCTNPLQGWKSRTVEKTGKRRVVFNANEGIREFPVQIPCGQCAGCRLEKARAWAMRCVHESQLHEQNMFLTLTYSNDNLPEAMGLDHRHIQLFMKRYRKRFVGEDVGQVKQIRYYMCGEYGDTTHRPHYHMLVFGHCFDDLVPVPGARDLFTSETLEDLWGLGFVTVGHVTFESASYVARYTMKKLNNASYLGETENGDLVQIASPYSAMSRRPGIGAEWYDRFKKEVIQRDKVVMRGRELQPPKYYDDLLEKEHPEIMEKLKAARKAAAKLQDHSSRRLYARELINKNHNLEREPNA